MSSLSPSSKNNLFTSIKKKLPTLPKGRPSDRPKEAVLSFLERADISYCKQGQMDTVYCGKGSNGEEFFKPCH